ncbi:ATP-binding protein [Sulfobacillus thermosulfidooxidans]|uniref:AAA family ATPase n=1 Tax=Sulfobacillus thermosulfidooxidans TaxID=28034 RepID=A0A2T2WR81_SULTH|nr:ATP-binding protein [Sulfobacillus thermosulfidooxidans]PSR24736.1 MAG: AAA family ATPase [Sulfobacillus thermosulfidooxidans]
MKQFHKATKTSSYLRMALVGPSGSGKTYSSLRIATALGARVAVIDSERGSASKYADEFAFDVLELDTFAPQEYIEAIHAAGDAHYDVLIIDSLSHAWMGKGGVLEMHDAATAHERGGNSYTAWRTVSPEHNRLVDEILRAPLHLIATMRSKIAYVQEKDDRGKTVVRKVGLQPVQRDGLDFEFDVVGDMDQTNRLVISKTRCRALAQAVIRQPGDEVARTLKAWLSDGPPAPARLTDDQVKALWQAAQHRGLSAEALLAFCNTLLGTQYATPREVLSTDLPRVLAALADDTAPARSS